MESFEHPTLGSITLNRSARARRISIGVRPGGELRLTLPLRTPLKEGVRFLEAKVEWIQRAQARVAECTSAKLFEPTFTTRSHRLVLNPCPTNRISVGLAERVIRVSYPIQHNYQEPQIQEAIQRGAEQAWRIEAKEYLPTRVAQLSTLTGLPYRRITIRNSRTRWGSCSAQNDLSLSLHLMRLPDHLIDYVLLHELCHSRHKNHGAGFHQLLNTLTSGAHPALRRELKGYSTR